MENNVTSNALYATVAGGWGNTASEGGATVGGGNGNTASGYGSTAGGGNGNTASGSRASVGGGDGNAASGYVSTVGGGWGNTASGEFATVAGGWNASATHYGEMAYASGDFTNPGDAQASEYVLRNITINATQTELFLDGGSSRLTLASGRALSFDILIVAEASTNGDSAGYHITGLIKNSSGTTALVGTPKVTILGEDVAAWNAVVAADNTDAALSIQVSGAAGKTIRWVASVRTVEVNW